MNYFYIARLLYGKISIFSVSVCLVVSTSECGSAVQKARGAYLLKSKAPWLKRNYTCQGLKTLNQFHWGQNDTVWVRIVSDKGAFQFLGNINNPLTNTPKFDDFVERFKLQNIWKTNFLLLNVTKIIEIFLEILSKNFRYYLF